MAESTPDGFNTFLERANRTISKDQAHVPDPFVDGGLAPNRPFGPHSRISSVEFIASIVEEKSDSLLNKAITSVSYL
jgi:alpha-1,3-glucan synthase